MPKFPRYESTAQLTTQTPSVGAVASTEGQITENKAKIGLAVADTAFKFIKALDTIQTTTAEVNFKSGMADILNRAQNDPDYNNSDQYVKEIEKLRQDNLKGFTSKTTETKMALNLGYESKVGQIQIDNIYKKKIVGAGQVKALEKLDLIVRNPPPEFEDEIRNELLKQTNAGVFSKLRGYEFEKRYIKEGKFNAFLIDFRADPVAAEKQFNKNSYGMDIETAEKARSKLKELKVAQREQEGNLYSDMSLRLTTGDLPEAEIDNAIAMNEANPNEGITEKHGKQLKAAMYRDITQRIGQKEFKRYREAVDFVFSSSAQDKIKGYEAILAAYTDGLTADEARFLKQILDTKKDVGFANQAAAGKKFIETLFGVRPKNVQKETQTLLLYARKIANGTSPETAAQETTLDLIKGDHPAVLADPDLAAAFTPSKGLRNIPKVKRESAS